MAPSEFGLQFARSLDIYEAIRTVVKRAANGSGTIDGAEAIRLLAAAHPGITMTDAELAEAVAQAAADAGVQLSYQLPLTYSTPAVRTG